MDTEKIIQDLNRRFSAPLPEFYKRRIIFWIDEDKEFEDRLDEIELPSVKIAVLTGSNSFAIKKLLTVDDQVSNYLVYRPFAYEKDLDNWLIDIELYSEEFHADLISIWMDELSIPASPALRHQMKHFRKFFNSKERRSKFSDVNADINTKEQLQKAVMATLCGIKKSQPANIIRTLLSAGLSEDTNTIYQSFIRYEAQDAFWDMVAQGTGYTEEKKDLGGLAAHLLLTSMTITMNVEHLEGLDAFISVPHQAFCYDMISDWLHSDKIDSLYEIARFIEEETRLQQRFMNLKVEDLVDSKCFPCINECILIMLMREIGDHLINVDAITATVEKRRTCVWYNDVKYFYDGILQVANMQEFYKLHSAGFHTVEAHKVWHEYTETYYVMDTYYRLFHLAYAESLNVYNSVLGDLFNQVMEKVEGLYTHWFLEQLGSNWSDACADDLAKYGHILNIDKQQDFYNSYVKTAENRIFVIISDALRYEVAASLAEQLRRETQSQVELGSCAGIFPTITKFGIAATLPHKELTVELRGEKPEKLYVMADGLSTESNARDKLLKSINPLSVALHFKDIVCMKRAERSALVKGMDVVYIYHNKIDETSHSSEREVFSACDEAISEIKNLVRIIVNDFGGTNIIITSDHGFLYTYSPLKEDDKIGKESFKGNDVEYGRRYAILEKGSEPEYLMPVKFLDGNTNYEGFTPRESVRIKMSGSGMNYVHGGISLQEMVVPVIEYHFLRNDSKEYRTNKSRYDTKPVTVNLLSATKKISNMIFSLNFYQKEAVGDNREACNYSVYFTDSNGKQISDVQRIIADKTSVNSQDRTFRCSFNLKPLKYSKTEIYYLVIADESGLQAPQRLEFQIDIAFAVDNFGFFD